MNEAQRERLHALGNQLLGEFDMPADRTADSWAEFVQWRDGTSAITTTIRLLEQPRQIDVTIDVMLDRVYDVSALVTFEMETVKLATIEYRYDEQFKLWEESD
jgi:hypothetical protein